MRPLSETDLYVLFNEYEDIFLFDKVRNKEIWRADMYGDATCGLVGLSNEWAIACGSKLIVWKKHTLKTIEDKELEWIFGVRQVGETKVEILTDPWSDHSAIWLFDVSTEIKTKIRDFFDYINQEYTEEVKW